MNRGSSAAIARRGGIRGEERGEGSGFRLASAGHNSSPSSAFKKVCGELWIPKDVLGMYSCCINYFFKRGSFSTNPALGFASGVLPLSMVSFY